MPSWTLSRMKARSGKPAIQALDQLGHTYQRIGTTDAEIMQEVNESVQEKQCGESFQDQDDKYSEDLDEQDKEEEEEEVQNLDDKDDRVGEDGNEEMDKQDKTNHSNQDTDEEEQRDPDNNNEHSTENKVLSADDEVAQHKDVEALRGPDTPTILNTDNQYQPVPLVPLFPPDTFDQRKREPGDTKAQTLNDKHIQAKDQQKRQQELDDVDQTELDRKNEEADNEDVDAYSDDEYGMYLVTLYSTERDTKWAVRPAMQAEYVCPCNYL
jgi:hypothetical protein